MRTIMCTATLWRDLGGRGPLVERAPNLATRGSLAGDWSAKAFITRAGGFVIGVHEPTYLTVLLPFLRLPDFIPAFAFCVGWQLEQLGAARARVKAESEAMLKVQFGKNRNRSLLGSVNDLAFLAEVELSQHRRHDPESLLSVQSKLNEVPHVHRSPSHPADAVRQLLGLDPSPVH